MDASDEQRQISRAGFRKNHLRTLIDVVFCDVITVVYRPPSPLRGEWRRHRAVGEEKIRRQILPQPTFGVRNGDCYDVFALLSIGRRFAVLCKFPFRIHPLRFGIALPLRFGCWLELRHMPWLFHVHIVITKGANSLLFITV